MHFKQWLEAGEYGTPSLISGAGSGTGMDNFGQELRLPRRKKRRPPLGRLGTVDPGDPRPPKDNIELVNTSMNSGGSGSFA